MDIDRAIELMEIEQQCVIRSDSCGRDCAQCDLVQNDKELIQAYDKVIEWLIAIRREYFDGGLVPMSK